MKIKKTAVLVLALVLVALTLTSCGSPAKKIIGTWSNSQTVLGITTETTYTFNEDGTGSYKAAILSSDFTYSFDDDGKLTIKTNLLIFGAYDVTYTCDFEDDTLRLTDVDNVSVTYTKVA